MASCECAKDRFRKTNWMRYCTSGLQQCVPKQNPWQSL